ncbi:MAG: WG repeat-containing protein [Bacteroidetes bacterium]|nr:WG repeat-containing protein [Bacteroidota bacterium]
MTPFFKRNFFFILLFSNSHFFYAQPAAKSEVWLAPVCKPKLFGLNDTAGNRILEPKYDYLAEQESNAWIALSAGKYGVINSKGEWIIKPEFLSIYQYSNGRAVAGKKIPNGTPKASSYSSMYNYNDSIVAYGVIDGSGTWTVDAAYDFIQICDDGELLYADEYGKYGFLARDGSVLIKARYDWATPMENGAFVMGEKKNDQQNYLDYSSGRNSSFASGNYFVMDKTGNKLNTDPYDMIREFSCGRAAFNKNGIWKGERYSNDQKLVGGEWGFLDANGKEIIKPIYDFVYDFEKTSSGSKAKVRMGSRNFWIDENGNETVPPLDERTSTYEVFCEPGSYGYIDVGGKWIIQPQFYSACEFSEGLAAAMALRASDLDCEQPEQDVIDYGDAKATNALSIFDIGLHRRYSDPSILTIDTSISNRPKRRLFGYIDISGNMVIEAKYQVALPFKNNRAYVLFRNKWGVIDRKGNWVIAPVLDWPSEMRYGQTLNSTEENLYNDYLSDAQDQDPAANNYLYAMYYSFSEGMGTIYKYGKYGFIDTTGKIIISPVYDEVMTFSNGFAAVRNGTKWGFVDHTGKEIIPLHYTSVGSFSKEGLARAAVFPNEADMGPPKNGMSYEEYEPYAGYIDKTGKWVIKPQFTSAGDFSEGLAPASVDYQLAGFIDRNGKFVIEPKYDYCGEFSDGIAYVKIRTYNGIYIDKTGKTSKIYTVDNPPPDKSVPLHLDVDANDRYGFIDDKGKVVIEHNYRKAGNFSRVK